MHVHLPPLALPLISARANCFMHKFKYYFNGCLGGNCLSIYPQPCSLHRSRIYFQCSFLGKWVCVAILPSHGENNLWNFPSCWYKCVFSGPSMYSAYLNAIFMAIQPTLNKLMPFIGHNHNQVSGKCAVSIFRWDVNSFRWIRDGGETALLRAHGFRFQKRVNPLGLCVG